jgi:type IV secretory pathway TrbD component
MDTFGDRVLRKRAIPEEVPDCELRIPTDGPLAEAIFLFGYAAWGALECLTATASDPTPDLAGLRKQLKRACSVARLLRGLERQSPVIDGVLAGAGITVAVYSASSVGLTVPLISFGVHQVASGASTAEGERERLSHEVRRRESWNDAYNYGWFLMWCLYQSTAFGSTADQRESFPES